MPVRVVTEPAVEPVLGSDALNHLRVDEVEELTYVEGLITAAREWCEQRQRRAYVTQTLEYSTSAFPTGNRINLPYPRLQSVESVTYTDEDGTTHTLDPVNYVVDTKSLVGGVVLKHSVSWPSVTLTPVNGITVRYVAGYGLASAVPKRIKQAILLLVGHWYENREAVTVGTTSRKLEMAVDALLAVDYVP